MAIPKVSKRKSEIIGMGVFLIGIGMLMYINFWWPTILLVIGASLMTKQYLRGRYYDMFISAFVCGGAFFFYWAIDWGTFLPIIFIIGGIYLVARELFFPRWRQGDEEVEDVREEIDDARRK